MSELRPLTEKQKKFCVEFIRLGSAKEAYIQAYKPARENNAVVMASRTLRLPNVQQEIARRQTQLEVKNAATLEEVQSFWAAVLRGEDEEATIRDKIKVSELIAKTKGAFIERVEHSGMVANVQINLVEQDIIDIKANKKDGHAND